MNTMNSPLYMRRRTSSQQLWGEATEEERLPIQQTPMNDLFVTGLRERKLVAMLLWLAVLSLLTILLFILNEDYCGYAVAMFQLNIALVYVLQMSHQGMRSLKAHTYIDERTGHREEIVHFAAQNINLGHVVTKSGRLVGSRDRKLTMQGSRVIAGTGTNSTRMLLQDGVCRLENVEQFQVVNPISGKMTFTAQRPLVRIDRGIKQLAANSIITNKIRSAVNDNLRLETVNVNLRGNEGEGLCNLKVQTSSNSTRLSLNRRHSNGKQGNQCIGQDDANAENLGSASTSLYSLSKQSNERIRKNILLLQADGSLRLNARKIFIGNQWKPALQLSSSPSLSASMDAYRLCVCSTGNRQKLFIVEGHRKCNAPAAICP